MRYTINVESLPDGSRATYKYNSEGNVFERTELKLAEGLISLEDYLSRRHIAHVRAECYMEGEELFQEKEWILLKGDVIEVMEAIDGNRELILPEYTTNLQPILKPLLEDGILEELSICYSGYEYESGIMKNDPRVKLLNRVMLPVMADLFGIDRKETFTFSPVRFI